MVLAVSHVIGKEYCEMIRLHYEGRIDEAREIHYKTLTIVRALFIEINPVPVKEALTMMELIRAKENG